MVKAEESMRVNQRPHRPTAREKEIVNAQQSKGKPRYSARKDAHGWDSDRCEQFLRENEHAKRAFEKVVARGVPRKNLILLMEVASDPNAGQRLAQAIVPSHDRRKRLAKRLKCGSQELREFMKSPLLSFFNIENGVTELADHMDTVAEQLESSPSLVKLCKTISAKALWNHFGLAWLCELVRKKGGTYEDVKSLLDAAYEARGRTNTFKAIEREIQRLFTRPGGRALRMVFPAFTKLLLPSPKDQRLADLARKIL